MILLSTYLILETVYDIRGLIFKNFINHQHATVPSIAAGGHVFIYELDGVGPVNNRPSTDKL